MDYLKTNIYMADVMVIGFLISLHRCAITDKHNVLSDDGYII